MMAHAEWRRVNNADNIVSSDCPNECRKQIAQINGVDKEGRPVAFVIAGRHDKNNRDISEINRFIIYLIETIIKMSNPDEETYSIVFDLSSFSLQCMDFESVRLLIDILQVNYPDVLGRAYVVNSPFIFSACWSVIRPWLDPVTANKVLFVKLDQLSEFIDAEHILPELGKRDAKPLVVSSDDAL